MLLAPWALPAVLLVGCIVALRVAGAGKYRTLSLRAAHSLLQGGNLVVLEMGVNIGDIAKALNAIGATPRDLIAIFQAIKAAGALQGELVIL